MQIDEGHGFSWNAIAHYVPGRTPNQCQHRYKKSADPTILKGAWSRNEDIALLKAVMQIGLDWSKIRDSNVVPGRTDLQLRDRYYNALSEKHIKGSWTREEDNLLREGHQKYGHQWTMVSDLVVKTRTDGQCLKRWGLLKEYKAKGGFKLYSLGKSVFWLIFGEKFAIFQRVKKLNMRKIIVRKEKKSKN